MLGLKWLSHPKKISRCLPNRPQNSQGCSCCDSRILGCFDEPRDYAISCLNLPEEASHGNIIFSYRRLGRVTMNDTANLHTASLYINNQLVSRGLLREGQTIDFLQIAGESEESFITKSRIISLINDLILRRDRDAEHRESLSEAMRSLGAENLKQFNDMARLREKNAEQTRRADLAMAAEASLRAQLKAAEAVARGQKEDVSRMKSLLAQVRSACAKEVRRRDRQIDTLKKQLGDAGRPRGFKTNPAVTTIHVTSEFGAKKGSAPRAGRTGLGDYDLRSESNAFLAKLAEDLSVENERMLNMVRRTMDRLGDMSGYQGDERGDDWVIKRPNCEQLAAELDLVMEHMRNILTNPSFVPIEEVMVRDQEIGRLRSGWIKMESRWKDAVQLMDGWCNRMTAGGTPVCNEELEMGLRLSPMRVQDVAETDQEAAMALSVVAEEAEDESEVAEEPIHRLDRTSPAPKAGPTDDGQDTAQAASSESEELLDEDKDNAGGVGIRASPRQQQTADSSLLPEPPRLSPLRSSASAGNRGSLQNRCLRPRPSSVAPKTEEKRTHLLVEAAADELRPTPMRAAPPARPVSQSRARWPSQTSQTSLDEALLAKPRRPPLPPHPVPEATALDADSDADSPLPSAKVAASERSADTERVRAKLQVAQTSRDSGVARPLLSSSASSRTGTDSVDSADSAVENVDPVKRDVVPPRPAEKRKRERTVAVKAAAARRRSTISPAELQALIRGSVADQG